MHCTRFDTGEVILAVVFQCERLWLPHILGILSCVGYIDQWSTPKVLTDRHFLNTGRCIECCTTCPRDLKQTRLHGTAAMHCKELTQPRIGGKEESAAGGKKEYP